MSLTIASLLIPSYRRNHRTSVLSQLSEHDLMEHAVSFCERNEGGVFPNKEKLNLKASFPSGLWVLFIMYLDIKMIGKNHGMVRNCFHLQKRNQGSATYIEFRHLLNKLRHELAVLDPLARQHYAAVRKNGGKSLQKTIKKEHAQYLKMYNAQKQYLCVYACLLLHVCK